MRAVWVRGWAVWVCVVKLRGGGEGMDGSAETVAWQGFCGFLSSLDIDLVLGFNTGFRYGLWTGSLLHRGFWEGLASSRVFVPVRCGPVQSAATQLVDVNYLEPTRSYLGQWVQVPVFLGSCPIF